MKKAREGFGSPALFVCQRNAVWSKHRSAGFMTKKTLGAALALFSFFMFSMAAYAYSEDVVASLDDETITVATLATYVDDVAGVKYKSWLHDKEGQRKLADFFINRRLLLEYARQNVSKKDTVVTNHNARNVDEDVMYLSTLLKIEVQDKVNVSAEDVDLYMKKNNVDSEKQARQEVESDLKNKLMGALVEKVRAGHEIKYF
ncbi:hypothetical protein P9J64_15760 [Deltaproteobacteria bacterium IMCC39524]|nr:hypothetical protein [Deltaproteobacteria bacterium IMCC39524]